MQHVPNTLILCIQEHTAKIILYLIYSYCAPLLSSSLCLCIDTKLFMQNVPNIIAVHIRNTSQKQFSIHHWWCHILEVTVSLAHTIDAEPWMQNVPNILIAHIRNTSQKQLSTMAALSPSSIAQPQPQPPVSLLTIKAQLRDDHNILMSFLLALYLHIDPMHVKWKYRRNILHVYH